MKNPHSTPPISIGYVLDEEVIDPEQCYGGIKIVINGDRLNKHVNESGFTSNREWKPEYEGVYLCTDMRELIAETTAAIREKSIYEEYLMRFFEFPERIIIEPLDENIVRIAFRASTQHNPDKYHIRAVPASACGYQVNLYDWGEEVHSAGTRLQNELHDQERKRVADSFDSLLDELRQELDRDE